MDEKLSQDYGSLIEPHVLDNAKNLTESDTLVALEYYETFIYIGLVPPDNILRIIARHIANYLDSDGRITLDMAFGLQPISSKGSALKHRNKMKWRNFACFLIWHRLKDAELRGDRPPTIVTAAEELINLFKIPHPTKDGEYYSADTLENYYYKHNCANELNKLHLETPGEIEKIYNTSIVELQAIDKYR